MIFTIHRYIFRELMKVFLLATIGLMLILSLGWMIQPIQEFGVGPEQAVHLLGYLLPITLTFVLPMGALFATALVYGRLASDNEFDACRASGISLTALVYPGLCLAISVAIATLVLSFHVVPAFVHRAEKSLKANAKQILFRNIQRQGYYSPPNSRFKIYADDAIEEDEILEGVIVIEFKDNEVAKYIPAETARVEIDSHETFNEVTVVAREAYQIDDLGQAYARQLPVFSKFESLLADNIKFQKIADIKKIKADMLEFYPIRQIAFEGRDQLAAEMLAESINENMADVDAGYYQLESEDIIVMLAAAGCEARDEQTIRLTGPIILQELDKDFHRRIHQWDSDEGLIKLRSDGPGLRAEMILESPRWQRGDGLKGLAHRHVVKNIALPQTIMDKINEEDLLVTFKDVSTVLKTSPTSYLTAILNRLWKKIAVTANEISAEMHLRMVFGIGCIPLVLIGIALGITFKGGHLLSAFGTSTAPAGALMVCIMAGKRLTGNPSTPATTGIAVMWGGLIALSLLALVVYRRLMRT